MSIDKTRVMIGGVLIAVGLLSLLHNLRWFRLSEEYVLSLIFSGAGLALVQHGRAIRRQWASFLGCALVIVGAIIFIAEAPFLPDELIGTMWLWLVAGVLYWVYQRNHQHWWVLLFGGPAFAAGLVVLLEGFDLLRGYIAGVLMNLGIAGTFAFIYSIRSPERKLDWAKYPAAVFFLIAVFILVAKEHAGALPVVLSGLFILSGLYIIYRTLRTDFGGSKPSEPNPATEAPQTS